VKIQNSPGDFIIYKRNVRIFKDEVRIELYYSQLKLLSFEFYNCQFSMPNKSIKYTGKSTFTSDHFIYTDVKFLIFVIWSHNF
jgi:hypothetical protein